MERSLWGEVRGLGGGAWKCRAVPERQMAKRGRYQCGGELSLGACSFSHRLRQEILDARAGGWGPRFRTLHCAWHVQVPPATRMIGLQFDPQTSREKYEKNHGGRVLYRQLIHQISGRVNNSPMACSASISFLPGGTGRKTHAGSRANPGAPQALDHNRTHIQTRAAATD